MNVAIFSITYDDYQVSQFIDLGYSEAAGAQLTSISLTNAAEVSTDGAEFEMNYRMTDNFTITGSIGILDATFDDFPGGTTTLSDPNDPNSEKLSINAAGNKIPFASDFNATLGLQYYSNIDAMGADLLMRLDIQHVGDYFTQIENGKTVDLVGASPLLFTLEQNFLNGGATYGIPATLDYGYIAANTLLHARIGLVGESWEIYAWGRNITDEDQFTNDTRGFFGSLQYTPQTPRTFGVEVIYNF